MSQVLLTLPHPQMPAAIAEYSRNRLSFLTRCARWMTLAIAPLKLLCVPEAQLTHLQIRYLNAMSRIDFVGVYGVLNESLW
ncbi:MAG: hypothetical protein KME35_08825 [Aphanocapsa sp. GSE-SYN-MK-11-07L]|jgi:hypothetical protein|nr:hypothetical protein [Aphanocapsa sp. GSE-SYN-MK-11-07L]